MSQKGTDETTLFLRLGTLRERALDCDNEQLLIEETKKEKKLIERKDYVREDSLVRD